MIALLLSWCLAFPAQHDAQTDAYWFAGDFAGRTDGAQIWSSTPIRATATYSDTVDIAPISLYAALPMRDHDGALQTQSDHAYTLYVCAAETRPRVLWMPIFQT